MSANRENKKEWNRQRRKWEGKGFCQSNHTAAVIVLVASITLKPYTHSATATDKCPQRSHFHMKAETEQKAIPTVCARSSPAVDSGSGCIHQQSRGKASAARTSNTAELPAFWSKEMRICLCLSLHHPCSSPTSAMKWGKSSDTPFHSGFVSTDQSPRFVLHLRVDVWVIVTPQEDVQFIYLYVTLLTHYVAACVLVRWKNAYVRCEKLTSQYC